MFPHRLRPLLLHIGKSALTNFRFDLLAIK